MDFHLELVIKRNNLSLQEIKEELNQLNDKLLFHVAIPPMICKLPWIFH
jgi:hypothetical protein